MNKKVNKDINKLTNHLIKDLKTNSIELVDLIAYNRIKNELLNKKYFE